MIFTKKKENKSLFKQVVSWDNICQGYLDLYESFTEKNKGFTYKGVDGSLLYDLEIDIETVLKEAQEELKSKTPLQPAKYIKIPKKNGGIRGIYILPVKERIKCQAIFRILEPLFEKQYSDNLYSFRKSHPSYYASRAVRRFYLRNLDKEMYVLKMDFHNYSDYHNHKFLLKVLKKFGVDKKVRDLAELFLHEPVVKDGALMSLCTGSMQGMNLCPLFNNIYAHHIDEYSSKHAHFYRRVGDDFIMFDRDKDKLMKLKKYVEKEAKKTKLVINREKTILCPIQADFDFLGLEYHDGIVRFPEKSIGNILAAWKKKLHYSPTMPSNAKIGKLKQFMRNSKDIDAWKDEEHFMHYVRSYNLINDKNQIKDLSRRLFYLITKYFTGGTTYKKMATTKDILKDYKFPSFSKLHYLYTSGKMYR